MTDEAFAVHMVEARRKIDSLPESQRAPLLKLLDETVQRQVDLKTNFSRLRCLLDDWRLKLKYMAFDLEATKRELTDLRKKQGDKGEQK